MYGVSYGLAVVLRCGVVRLYSRSRLWGVRNSGDLVLAYYDVLWWRGHCDCRAGGKLGGILVCFRFEVATWPRTAVTFKRCKWETLPEGTLLEHSTTIEYRNIKRGDSVPI